MSLERTGARRSPVWPAHHSLEKRDMAGAGRTCLDDQVNSHQRRITFGALGISLKI